MLSFLVSNGLIRVKFKNEAVLIITHDCDLPNLFPDNPLIGDWYGEPRRSSNSLLQWCCVSFSGVSTEHSQTSRTDLSSKTIKGPWLLTVFCRGLLLRCLSGFCKLL